MKRVTVLVLALAMAFTMAVPSFAESSVTTDISGVTGSDTTITVNTQINGSSVTTLYKDGVLTTETDGTVETVEADAGDKAVIGTADAKSDKTDEGTAVKEKAETKLEKEGEELGVPVRLTRWLKKLIMECLKEYEADQAVVQTGAETVKTEPVEVTVVNATAESTANE